MENRKLSFGLMRLPLKEKDGNKIIDDEEFKLMADKFIENGFYHFDTAYVYHRGESEKAFGRCVADRYPREKFTLTDKMPFFDLKQKEDMERIFNEQLERCHVKYFDVYFLHCITSKIIKRVEEFDGFGFIKKKKEEGFIKRIGFSYHDKAELLDEILTKHPEIEIVQLQINYVDFDDIDVQSALNYEVCVKHHVDVFVMEPVKGGALVRLDKESRTILDSIDKNASNASFAIRFAASLDNVKTVLSGMSNLSQMEDNISYMKDFKPLNKDEFNKVLEVANHINSLIAFKCTNCGYCLEGCPKNIKINEYFELYNDQARFGYVKEHHFDWWYHSILRNSGKPSDCINCKSCMSRCPQHLSIPENLKKVSELLEK